MKKLIYSMLAVLALTASCTGDNTQMVSLGIDDVYFIPRMKSCLLQPAFTGDEYRWTFHHNGKDSVVSTERDYIFLAKDTGTYKMTFEIIDSETPYRHDFLFNVVHEEVEYSAYLSKVYDYCPAPGQFVNTMPEYIKGETKEDMIKKVEENISGTNDVMISLGGYGGYVIFGFDHTMINVKGKKDFSIYGNSFYSDIDAYKEKKGGSCEPGIVMVSFDKNQNGQPDDEWYELAGSEYYKPETRKNYSITYSRPDPNHKPVPDMSSGINDSEYIRWTDNYGEEGYIAHNKFHDQEYFPGWLKDDKLTFSGTCLKNNGRDESGFGQYYVLYSYEWGYVDNHPNQFKDLISFDIDWAVDADGNKVHLPGVDFIKVYTAINQQCGRIGETSTEIIRARDLHIDVEGERLPDIEGELQRQYENALNKIESRNR